MIPYDNRLNPLVKRMAEDMLVRNFSPSTIDSDTYQVDRFQKHANARSGQAIQYSQPHLHLLSIFKPVQAGISEPQAVILFKN